MNRIFYAFWALFLAGALGCAGLQPKPIFTTQKPGAAGGTGGGEPAAGNPAEEVVLEEKDRSSPDLWRERLMREIDDLLGTPYRYGGEGPGGMDCSGFVQYVYRKSLNLSLPRSVADLLQAGVPVSPADLQFGDLVFFRNLQSRKIDHVGIYLGQGQFAHATRSRGVTISSLNSSYFRDRLVRARRVLRK